MPYYDYECGHCGRFELRRTLAELDTPVQCPRCDALATRVLSAPYLAVMNPHNRIAHARNEKSAHEPKLVQHSQLDQAGHKRAHAHAHHHSHAPLHKGLGAGWVQASRPWMIGH